jgi:GTP-binding protein
VPFERNGQRFELIDTAGLRRKGKVFEAIEKFSVVKTLQAIESANVVLLLLDATQGVTDQDAHIAGYILESGRAVVLADQQVGRGRQLPARADPAPDRNPAALPQVRCAALHLGASSARGWGRSGRPLPRRTSRPRARCRPRCSRGCCRRRCSSRRPSGPACSGPSCVTPTRAGMNPPVIVIHGNSLEHVTDAYKRFLEGRFRKEFDLVGTPLAHRDEDLATTRTPTRNRPCRMGRLASIERRCATTPQFRAFRVPLFFEGHSGFVLW